MKNITSIFIILVTIFILNSCGFHTPNKHNSVNFNISGDNEFASIIKAKLNTNTKKTATINILKVSKNKTNASYSSGVVSNYDLEVVVEYEVYKDDKKVHTNQISSSFYLKNLNNSANEYQENLVYKELQEELATKIIRKASRL